MIERARQRLPLALVAGLWLAPGAAGQASPQPPPGLNVHLVEFRDGTALWRGAAPKRETLTVLAAEAKRTGRTATLFDLRKPANSDDASGKSGRLSPTAEAAACGKLGLKYVAISALDKEFIPRLKGALQEGAVYVHCMYGVNRTGFACGRYEKSTGRTFSRKGAGSRDWRQGEAFESKRKAGR